MGRGGCSVVLARFFVVTPGWAIFKKNVLVEKITSNITHSLDLA